MARKYFGDEEPVGKTLELTLWESGTYTVTGVIEDVLPTSHLQFDFLFPLEDLVDKEQFQQQELYITYLELDENVNSAALEYQITETYKKNLGAYLASRNMDVTFYLQPLTDIHLNGEIAAPATRTGNKKLVYFFTIIGLMTLVIALVNYVNLATAQAMGRAREVGVRKVVGAQKKQLIGQFLLESALTNIIALVLAITLSLLLLPVVNRVAGVDMSPDLWLNGRFWTAFLGLFGLGALLSGLYPAFILSSFKPAVVLKGKAGAFASRVALRKVLVIIQFAVSIALLVGTTIVYSQLSYMRSLDTGLDLEQILVVEGPKVRSEGSNPVAEMSALKNELRKLPAAQKIGLSSNTPGRGFSQFMPMYRVTADPSTGKFMRGAYIDQDFPGVYGLELVAGEPFYEGMTGSDSGDVPIMVNETFVQTLGFSSNEEAVNERITAHRKVFVVRGVYRDFQWSSAHQEREAVMFLFEPGGGSISMKVTTQKLPETIAAVEKTYKSLLPGNPFHYSFADAAFDEQYRADRRFASLFAGFAGIAIIIACLGLFGLVAFTAQQRTKEIGIRKTLGASVSSLVALLSTDFLKLVGLAFLVATPLAYFAMQRWLDGFAYHIEIGPGIFLVIGVVVLLIALLTVSYQSIRAALADPVKSLRYE
jgi:putative ABC transport system permease protein